MTHVSQTTHGHGGQVRLKFSVTSARWFHWDPYPLVHLGYYPMPMWTTIKTVFFPVTNPTTKLFCLCHKIKTHSHIHNDLPSTVATIVRLAHDHVHKLSEVDNNGICFAALVWKRIILWSLSLWHVFLYFKHLLFYI